MGTCVCVCVCCGKDINSLHTVVTRLSSKSKNRSIISLSKRSHRQVAGQEMYFGAALCVFLPKSSAGRHFNALLSLWIWGSAASRAKKPLFETLCERSERPDWDASVEIGNESHLISTPHGVWFWFAKVTFHCVLLLSRLSQINPDRILKCQRSYLCWQPEHCCRNDVTPSISASGVPDLCHTDAASLASARKPKYDTLRHDMIKNDTNYFVSPPGEKLSVTQLQVLLLGKV